MLDRPIILIGFHRSGTSLLGRVFDQHPDIAFWGEPRHVWMHHFAYRSLDVLNERHARRRVKAQIQRDFEQYLQEHGGSRFAEKTPSNIVRMRFINAVFPDAKFIHIIRHGMASTASTVKILQNPVKGRRVRRRMAETPWWQYPAYIPKFWRAFVQPRLPGGRTPYWGPRIPHLRKWVRSMPIEEVCARQWRESLRIALDDARELPSDRYREWRYEQLVTEPIETVRSMFEFAELDQSQQVDTWLGENITQASLGKWREAFTAEQIARLEPELQPMLGKLGYSVDAVGVETPTDSSDPNATATT